MKNTLPRIGDYILLQCNYRHRFALLEVYEYPDSNYIGVREACYDTDSAKMVEGCLRMGDVLKGYIDNYWTIVVIPKEDFHIAVGYFL